MYCLSIFFCLNAKLLKVLPDFGCMFRCFTLRERDTGKSEFSVGFAKVEGKNVQPNRTESARFF